MLQHIVELWDATMSTLLGELTAAGRRNIPSTRGAAKDGMLAMRASLCW